VTNPWGIILDLDGTIYRDSRVIPGAPEAIARLRRQGHDLVFVTNAIESPAEHVVKLAQFDIPTRPEEIINASLVLSRHLSHLVPNATVFAISDPPLLEQLRLFFRLSEDPNEIDVVIASCDRTFDYHKLNVGFQALRRGARFWATNGDATCPVPGGELPDAGAVIGALEGCSNRKVELVVGKPSPVVAEIALEQLGRSAQECLIVGDRLETDILMGHRAGMRTALVLSGVTRQEDLTHAIIRPDYVLESITQLPQLLNHEGDRFKN
jgi:arabinose operon protein AraL